MDSTTGNAAADGLAAPAPSSTGRGRGGSGRGRGGRGGAGASERSQNGESGRMNGSRERGSRRPRGRGNRQGDQSQRQISDVVNGEAALPSLSAQQPGVAPTIQVDATDEAVDDVEAEICFICASPVEHNSVAPCNHRTCHICALRLRALYKNKTCAHCRSSADYVIFTDDPEKHYEDFGVDDISSTDNNLGIKYEKPVIFEDTILLLRYNCPDGDCDVACLGWPDLHRHVKTVHHKMLCDLCTRNKKVFTHEHELFTLAELRKHEKYGDDNPGAIDQSGFKGHPECGFCRQRFYGDDELFAHCRDKHERCHVCDRRTGGRNPQYYVDYNALDVHFRKDHFACPDQECLDKKFVVFDSEMDLKAHQLEAHPNGLTKDARRDARRVDISGFDYRAPHQPERQRREGREGREGRGRGRGRDPNAEPLPMSSAQPMRRDELAYQRSMAIQSAQSVSTRTFGGQLTQQETYAARPPPNAAEPPTVAAPRSAHHQTPFPSLDSLAPSLPPPNGTSPRPSSPAQPAAPLTPQEQARRLRHAAVTERASNLLRNDAAKLSTFRAQISSYRSSAISAAALIDAFFALFDTSSAELGKLIKEVADIFEIASKRDSLLKAWGDWKAINEDYPSLPHGASSGASSSAAGMLGQRVGPSRVLKLKSSTQQSSRSAVSRSGSWGSAANGNLFPPVSAAVRSSGAGAAAKGPRPTKAAPAPAWLASSSSTSSSARPSPLPSRAPSSLNLSARAGAGAAPAEMGLFPALPPGKKPTSSVFSPGYTGRGVSRPSSTAPVGSAWGAAGADEVVNPGVEEGFGESDGSGAAGKGKGKGKKKQMLFQWG